jgi:hypothetical protein
MTTLTDHLYVARKVSRDPAIPRWLRGLILFGLLPIPGPVDNIALAVAVAILVLRYRDAVAVHYATTRLAPIEPADTWGAWC